MPAANMPPYRVVDVRFHRTPEQRAAVVYVGRAFAGWPAHPLANPYTARRYGPSALLNYRSFLDRLPGADLLGHLDALREATGDGKKPLGCWCGDWWPGLAVNCHAAVLAVMLNVRHRAD